MKVLMKGRCLLILIFINKENDFSGIEETCTRFLRQYVVGPIQPILSVPKPFTHPISHGPFRKAETILGHLSRKRFTTGNQRLIQLWAGLREQGSGRPLLISRKSRWAGIAASSLLMISAFCSMEWLILRRMSLEAAGKTHADVFCLLMLVYQPLQRVTFFLLFLFLNLMECPQLTELNLEPSKQGILEIIVLRLLSCDARKSVEGTEDGAELTTICSSHCFLLPPSNRNFPMTEQSIPLADIY